MKDREAEENKDKKEEEETVEETKLGRRKA